jgi:RND family efflux transporter MFP subunit
MTRTLPALAAFAVAALALTACGEAPRPETAPAAAAVGERLAVRAAMAPDYKPVAATVTTRRMGEARARIGGTLVRLNVKEGDEVRKGQVLALVTDQRLTLETQGYGAQVASAAAQAARAQADYGRIKTLYDQGIYAKARLDQAEAEAKGAEGALRAARAQQGASAELGAQGAILAPTSGRVLKADVPAGSVVAAGQTVATVTAGEPLLRIEIPEAEGRAMKVGDTVRITPGDLPGAAQTGTIVQVYPAVTAGRLTADITVAGLSADFVGQRVRVTVKVAERSALTVPLRFVATRYGVDYVRVLDKAGRASDVAVQIAPGPDAGRVEVLSGLVDGDVIVAPRVAS